MTFDTPMILFPRVAIAEGAEKSRRRVLEGEARRRTRQDTGRVARLTDDDLTDA